MRRFAVVKHNPAAVKALSMHGALASYHWETLDSEHVLLLTSIHVSTVGALDAHPDVLLLPSIYSSRTLGDHAAARGKHTHLLSLGRLGINGTHKTVHLAEAAYEVFGAKFALDA